MSVAADIYGDGPGRFTASTDPWPGDGVWPVGQARADRRVDPRVEHDLRRPSGRPLSYERHRVAVSRAPHGRGEQEVGWGAVLVGTLATALVLAGFLGLAQWRVGDAVPNRTEVVQVRGGESLGDLAARVSPGVVVEQVVERIVELNALSGSGLHPGQSLIVPVSTAG